MAISVTEMIACAEREVGMRKFVFPRRVGNHQMTQKKSDYEIACMEAIVEKLKSLPTDSPQLDF